MNNLVLNTSKTEELTLEYRKKCDSDPAPLCINGACVERVQSFKFLCVHLSGGLSWTANTAATVKKACQRLYFPRFLRRNNLERRLMIAVYRAAIESVLTCCI